MVRKDPRQRMDVWFCEGRSHSREATCELRILWQVRCARSHERASGDLCFPLTKTYMEVGNSETELEETAGDLPVP